MRRSCLRSAASIASVTICALAGCQTKHTIAVEPIKVEPIYLTVDVNVRLDHELEEAFGYQERIESEISETAPSSGPPASNATSAPVPGGVS